MYLRSPILMKGYEFIYENNGGNESGDEIEG